jgi:endonuclease YncB( thermonuclease family)
MVAEPKRKVVRVIGVSRILVAILVLLGLHGQTVASELLPVKVVSITDGDTVGVINADKRYFKVRLEGIDAPEQKQAFGTKSKEALAAKVHERDIILDEHGKDWYGRTLGVLKVDGRDINREMVAEGWAWQFVQYDKSAALRDAQANAKRERLGLWADAQPVAPWEFRKQEREKAKVRRVVAGH